MDPAQGFTAQSAGAAVVLAASHVGFPLSTTHVMAGGVMGAGAGKRVSAVRWGVAGNMAIAWLLTLPGAAAVGAVTYGATSLFGSGVLGPAIIATIAIVALVVAMTQARARRSRRGRQERDRDPRDRDRRHPRAARSSSTSR